MSKFGRHCYNLVEKRLRWRRAEEHCSELGGHLASAHKSEENGFISGLADGQSFWIGSNDMKYEGNWVWSDGSDFKRWRSGQPNNLFGEDCMKFYS